MMLPQLGLLDVSLWLAINAIVLLATSELLPTRYENASICINLKRLRNVAVAVSMLFLATVAIQIANIVLAQ